LGRNVLTIVLESMRVFRVDGLSGQVCLMICGNTTLMIWGNTTRFRFFNIRGEMITGAWIRRTSTGFGWLTSLTSESSNIKYSYREQTNENTPFHKTLPP